MTQSKHIGGAAYTELAMAFVPKRWTVEYRRNLTGRCYYARRVIAAPRPTTLRALHIFLHECAHARLHGLNEAPRHREEYEAETWAFARMVEAGIEPDPKSVESAKAYVRRKIVQAVKRNAKNIDQEAATWCGWEDQTRALLANIEGEK